jgi:hypothetical protein
MSCPSGHCKDVFHLPLHTSKVGSDVLDELSTLPSEQMHRKVSEIYRAVEERLAARKGGDDMRTASKTGKEVQEDLHEEAHRLMRQDGNLSYGNALRRACEEHPDWYRQYDAHVKSGVQQAVRGTEERKLDPIEAEKATVLDELKQASEGSADYRRLALTYDEMTRRAIGRREAEGNLGIE